MSIQDLPNELARSVFRFLSTTDNTAVSLTCKLWHALVESILYSSFVQQGTMSASSFISTLIEDPPLAQHLKTLYIRDQGVARFGTKSSTSLTRLYTQYPDKIRSVIELYLESLTWAELCELLTDRPETLRKEMTKSWYEGLQRRGHFEYHLSLLLILLPNLENLTVCQYAFDPGFALRILSIAGQLQRRSDRNRIGSLSKLKALSIRAEDDGASHLIYDIPISRLTPILQMPSLQSFACWKMGGTIGVSPTHETALQSLVLMECDFSPQQLEPIVLKLTNLRTLKIESVDSLSRNEYRVWPRLVESLTHLHDSLESLSIQDSEALCRGSFLRLPPLAKFHKLRFLEIEADFLENISMPVMEEHENRVPNDYKFLFYDFSTFPSSLKKLIIHQNGYISALEHLQSNSLNLPFPRLKSILVNCQHNPTGSPVGAAREVSRRYLQNGVSLTFRFNWEEEIQVEGGSWHAFTWIVCATESGLESDEVVRVKNNGFSYHA